MHHTKFFTFASSLFGTLTGMDNEIFNTFDAPHEQGTGEWKAFNAVTHDKASIYSAAMHYKPRPRIPTAIRFGDSRLFILKRA